MTARAIETILGTVIYQVESLSQIALNLQDEISRHRLQATARELRCSACTKVSTSSCISGSAVCPIGSLQTTSRPSRNVVCLHLTGLSRREPPSLHVCCRSHVRPSTTLRHCSCGVFDTDDNIFQSPHCSGQAVEHEQPAGPVAEIKNCRTTRGRAYAHSPDLVTVDQTSENLNPSAVGTEIGKIVSPSRSSSGFHVYKEQVHFLLHTTCQHRYRVQELCALQSVQTWGTLLT